MPLHWVVKLAKNAPDPERDAMWSRVPGILATRILTPHNPECLQEATHAILVVVCTREPRVLELHADSVVGQEEQPDELPFLAHQRPVGCEVVP